MINITEFNIKGEHNPEIDSKHAAENYAYMAKHHGEDIRRSIENSKIYNGEDVPHREKIFDRYPEKHIRGLDNIDSVGAIYKYHKDGERIAVLNFADYLTPGGCYMDGSDFAQEEALCHESDLYNVLEAFTESFYLVNREDYNNHLYYDKAIYSKDILFNRDGKEVYADVITCAAPHAILCKYAGIADSLTLRDIIHDRLDFIVRLAEMNNVDTLILGAFGCGAFGNDPYDVCRICRRPLGDGKIKNMIFAIPGGRNYDIFAQYIVEL